jgi:hypothetical protein
MRLRVRGKKLIGCVVVLSWELEGVSLGTFSPLSSHAFIMLRGPDVPPSLAVALGCATTHPIHITDQVPMFALMQRNISLNALSPRVIASIYDWGTPQPTQLPRHPDIILAADCVYFEPAFPLLQQTLADLIGEKTVCYFCYKKRRRADMQFMKVARKMFEVVEVMDDEDKEVYGREGLFL